MNIIEALQALKDGKKIRKTGWKDITYLCVKGNYVFRESNILCPIYIGDADDLNCTDWELYTEPLKLTPEEIKALKLARDCGFNIVYRNKYDSNGVAVAVKSEPISYWFVGYAPSLSCLSDSDWITNEPMSINELLKDEV